MLQICVDDSGHYSGPVVLYGALVARPESWLSFTREWQSELDENPRAVYFKIQDAVKKDSEYCGMSRPEMVAYKIVRLSEIVQRHVGIAVHFAMSLRDYRELLQPLMKRIERARSSPDDSRIDHRKR